MTLILKEQHRTLKTKLANTNHNSFNQFKKKKKKQTRFT